MIPECRDYGRRNAGTVGALENFVEKSGTKHLKNAGTVGAEVEWKVKMTSKMQGLWAQKPK